jgi:hypothetical protein
MKRKVSLGHHQKAPRPRHDIEQQAAHDIGRAATARVGLESLRKACGKDEQSNPGMLSPGLGYKEVCERALPQALRRWFAG